MDVVLVGVADRAVALRRSATLRLRRFHARGDYRFVVVTHRPCRSCPVGVLEIILIVLLILVLLGAFGYGGGRYRAPGGGLAVLLVIIIIILLLT